MKIVFPATFNTDNVLRDEKQKYDPQSTDKSTHVLSCVKHRLVDFSLRVEITGNDTWEVCVLVWKDLLLLVILSIDCSSCRSTYLPTAILKV